MTSQGYRKLDNKLAGDTKPKALESGARRDGCEEPLRGGVDVLYRYMDTENQMSDTAYRT